MRVVVIGLAMCVGACTFSGAPGQPPAAGDAAPSVDGSPDAAIEDDAAVFERCVEPPAGVIAWWDGEALGVDIAGDFDMSATTGSPEVSPGHVGDATTIDDGERVTIDPPTVSTFTIEGWVRRTTDDQDYQTIYGRECRGGLAGNPRAGLFLFEHKLTMWFASGGLCPGTNLAQSDTELAIDTWHHVAATYDGTSIRLYLDGAADGAPVDSSTLGFHPSTVHIGGANIDDGQNLVGQIDELTLYERALEPGEITSIAEAGTAGKCKPSGVRSSSFPGF